MTPSVATTPPASARTVFTIERAEQLKALAHPLRLRVLETLGGEHEQELTNRELAQRLGVDPGHLHFHVRMLHRAGLIELAEHGRGREKPYRAIAQTIRVSDDLLSSGAANPLQAAMLEEVHRGWTKYGPSGRFRSAQVTVRLPAEQMLELVGELVERACALEDPDHDPVVVTALIHPPSTSA